MNVNIYITMSTQVSLSVTYSDKGLRWHFIYLGTIRPLWNHFWEAAKVKMILWGCFCWPNLCLPPSFGIWLNLGTHPSRIWSNLGAPPPLTCYHLPTLKFEHFNITIFHKNLANNICPPLCFNRIWASCPSKYHPPPPPHPRQWLLSSPLCWQISACELFFRVRGIKSETIQPVLKLTLNIRIT